jgi:membrane-associated protein
MAKGFAAVGAPAAVGLVALSEAAVPVPFPGDALMLFIGERAAAGAIPVWLAVIGLEAATTIGVLALFYAARGPAAALLNRVGPRLGLTSERMGRATSVVERRGGSALAVGRAAPGFRTLSVVVAATSNVTARKALPALVLGGSLFVQLHLVLGYLFGPLAADLVHDALPVALALGVIALAIAFVVLRWRRGRDAAASGWAEAACPACLALGHLADRRLAAVAAASAGSRGC